MSFSPHLSSAVPVPLVPGSPAEEACVLTVGIRELCNFTARQGDLDLRFTPAPSALEGIQGHALVRARRAAEYESEVSLSGRYGPLLVRGRADGYDPLRCQVEEIKTYRGDLARMPENQRQLHWAQARVYGYLLCEKLGLPELRVALVYYNIDRQEETVLVEARAAGELKEIFEDLCRRFLHWAQAQATQRAERDAGLGELAFPWPAFRPGQRLLAESVWKAAASGRPLLAQAPTGIGKTVGTLFPMLKAMPSHGLDKLFCLSAKTTGRSLAIQCLQGLKQQPGARPLRVLELVARDKACEHPDRACHGASCPLARGFYDRLPAARRAAAEHAMLDRASLRTIALKHEVCPYYLAQEMARWCDVIAGDYNYWFDLSAMLHAMSQEAGWQVGLLVDEAHNLLERARKMYTATLDPVALALARREAGGELKKALSRVARHWPGAPEEGDYALAPLPDKLLQALQQFISSTTDFMAQEPEGLGPDLQRFFFDALHFSRVAELFDEHFLFDTTSTGAGRRPRLCLRNLVPAPLLAPRFAAARASTLFSATLSPWHFHADTLGLPQNLVFVDVPPAFQPEQLEVRILTDLSTRYPDRAASLQPIAQVMGSQFERQPGNYLAFFSSFDYLGQALEAFKVRYPQVPVWVQERQMDEASRDAFLARFTPQGEGIGFAVLGGVFGEGIDLPGKRLVGAFIATLGLPQVNPINEQVAQRMQTLFGAGYAYTYFYPGLQKVVQAAGRVIRSESDQGVLVLMDERFARGDARSLFPSWWQPRLCRLQEAVPPPPLSQRKPKRFSSR